MAMPVDQRIVGPYRPHALSEIAFEELYWPSNSRSCRCRVWTMARPSMASFSSCSTRLFPLACGPTRTVRSLRVISTRSSYANPRISILGGAMAATYTAAGHGASQAAVRAEA